MILKCILLALSASIDALGLGLTYGIKNTFHFLQFIVNYP